jgi:sterol desaturase/sphingolipid hydroxylase (fatty acid hydroxylase superfamily)
VLVQHSNVDVRLGPLNWVFSMADVHRWHHSVHREEMNTNYGAVLLVWDVVFGTRFAPRDRTVEPSDVAGLDSVPEYPTGWFGQILSPFRRRLWQKAG